jgi:hypothetical protein
VTARLPWTRAPQRRVFISYRRDDTKWVAGRLADSLTAYFGDKRVFRDIGDIPGGADFGQVIRGNLGMSDAAIVLIGPDWLKPADGSDGTSRLHDPDDWVAHEVGAAMEKGIPVFPVLVDGTPMPRAAELPDHLRALTRYNAITLSDDRWDADVNRLARIVSLDIPSENERKLHGLNLLVSLSLLTVALVTLGLLFNSLMHLVPALLSLASCSPSVEGAPSCLPSLGQAGISFVAIVPCSAMLFVFARLVDARHKPYFLAAAWAGTVGAMGSFLLLLPIDPPYEELAMVLGSSATILVMLVCLSLSGFRPRQ